MPTMWGKITPPSPMIKPEAQAFNSSTTLSALVWDEDCTKSQSCWKFYLPRSRQIRRSSSFLQSALKMFRTTLASQNYAHLGSHWIRMITTMIPIYFLAQTSQSLLLKVRNLNQKKRKYKVVPGCPPWQPKLFWADTNDCIDGAKVAIRKLFLIHLGSIPCLVFVLMLGDLDDNYKAGNYQQIENVLQMYVTV